MTTESSREAFVVLLIGAATVAVAASSATTSTALLLSEFDDAGFEDEDLEEGDELLHHFVPRPRPALPYCQCDFLPYFREELTEVGCQFHMRFSKAKIVRLAGSLKLKDITFGNHRFAPPILPSAWSSGGW